MEQLDVETDHQLSLCLSLHALHIYTRKLLSHAKAVGKPTGLLVFILPLAYFQVLSLE